MHTQYGIEDRISKSRARLYIQQPRDQNNSYQKHKTVLSGHTKSGRDGVAPKTG